MAMKNDKYFRNSVILADIMLFAILCYIGALGTAAFAVQLCFRIAIEFIRLFLYHRLKTGAEQVL